VAGVTDLQLELFDGTNTFAFAYDGRLKIHQEYQYNESPNPPVLRQIVERWTFTNARIQGNTPALMWDAFDAFLTHTEDQATSPLTLARLVRDPGGTPVVERTLGGSAQEGFRLEEITFGEETEEALGQSEFRSIIPVTFTLATFRVFADSDLIVAFEQTIRNSYSRAGLHTLEWETSISAAEGSATGALSLGDAHAVIPISDFGNTYVFDTNGSRGFDWEELDADTRTPTDRTPTKLRFVSRIRQLGIAPGTPTAGESLGAANIVNITEYKGGVTRTITEVTAEGPGSLEYVQSQRPGGLLKEYFERHEQGTRLAHAKYVSDDTPEGTQRRTVSVTIRGGADDFEFVSISGPFAPRLALGPKRPLRADVVIKITFEGVRPSRDQMMFPPILDDPWMLQRNLSTEDALPRLLRPGADGGADSWVREARLVYQSADQGESSSPNDFDILFEDSGSDVPGYILDR